MKREYNSHFILFLGHGDSNNEFEHLKVSGCCQSQSLARQEAWEQHTRNPFAPVDENYGKISTAQTDTDGRLARIDESSPAYRHLVPCKTSTRP